jgi:HD-GYP domain-containing protein (c-di-GMP phosphodiesterase class II)
MAGAFGDEVAFGTETFGFDWGRASEMLPAALRAAARGRGPIGGMVAMARAMGKLSKLVEVGRAHCEVAIHLAERFGFESAFREALFQAFERWDGSGKPNQLKGEAIALPMRIAHVAGEVNVGHRLGGVEGAVALTRKRARRGLDPALIELFAGAPAKVCESIAGPSAWDAAMAAEPGPAQRVEGDAIDAGLQAIAHFADLKSRFTRSHSSGVAARVAGAARKLRLGDELERTLARAALVHDVGRVAVSAGIWDKAEPLTDSERERIRLHSYVGERVLSRAPGLSPVAELAVLAHERLDGSGYHRRLPGSACSLAARILAAADVYQALGEERPHRAARSADAAAAELDAMAKAGTLCPEAVDAVLAVSGHKRSTAERPRGLSDREIEVLGLVARGLTNKEVANALGLSTKTAGHHLQHIYEKLGVTTRAAATVIAMHRGLLPS